MESTPVHLDPASTVYVSDDRHDRHWVTWDRSRRVSRLQLAQEPTEASGEGYRYKTRVGRRFERLSKCARGGGQEPTVWRTEDRTRSGVAGLHYCDSVCCPHCGPLWRRDRALVDAAVVDHAISELETVHFATLTLANPGTWDEKTLAHRYATLARVWSRTLAALRSCYGRLSWLRVYDEVWTEASGWHAHIHALILSPGHVHVSRAVLAREWLSAARHEGTWAGEEAQDLQIVKSGSELAGYVWGLASEIHGGSARGAIPKRGHDGGGRTPFSLLESDCPWRWVQWVRATVGVRTSQGSRDWGERRRDAVSWRLDGAPVSRRDTVRTMAQWLDDASLTEPQSIRAPVVDVGRDLWEWLTEKRSSVLGTKIVHAPDFLRAAMRGGDEVLTWVRRFAPPDLARDCVVWSYGAHWGPNFSGDCVAVRPGFGKIDLETVDRYAVLSTRHQWAHDVLRGAVAWRGKLESSNEQPSG